MSVLQHDVLLILTVVLCIFYIEESFFIILVLGKQNKNCELFNGEDFMAIVTEASPARPKGRSRI